MKTLAKAIALSAILGGAVITTPAQAWFGGFPGNGWGGGPWGGNGGPWGGYPGYGNTMDDWMDGTGWGDMNFSTSMGGRGYGRGYDRYYHQPYYGYPGWGGYPGYGVPYGGGYGAPYGGGYGAPYGGGYGAPYGAAPYSGRDYQAPPSSPAPEQNK